MTDEQVLEQSGLTREQLGQLVRRAWEKWARTQPDVADHPSWITPWVALDERDREADRQIGEALFCSGWRARLSAHDPAVP